LRGIFTFALAFTLTAALLSIALLGPGLGEKMREAEATAMEMERNNFLRSMVEKNVDSIIGETIEREIRNRNYDPEKINSAIGKELKEYFERIEEEFGEEPKIEFFLAEEKNIFRGVPVNGEFLELQNPEALFKTIVVNIKEHLFLVECSFTGGKNRGLAIAGKISSGHASTYFLIPAGYSVKKAVVV